MSDTVHFTQAPQEIMKEFTKALDQTAVEMGRTNSRDDRVDWVAVNHKMKEWWKDKGYAFP
ncbi:MAG: hypothetical protein KDI74_11955 [Gammaproteobacteria bacterium]|nr:hypothetical protein [Gammaproteobacteria bacterium]